MKFRHLYTILFLSTCFVAESQDQTIRLIYDKLCTSLQLQQGQIPRLEISTASTTGASFSKKKYTIIIDQKLIESFDILKEFRNTAIAFVLGHELCHALDKDKNDTDFLAYDRSKGASYINEQNADIQGAFLSYLSGYNCLPVMSEIIETIYATYKLGSVLSGYPSLNERIESVLLVKEQVESLIAIFKAANLAMLSNNHEIAKKLFEKILSYYPSPEVENNAAINYILEALNLGNYNNTNYIFPLEIDWELRLSKPNLPLGQKELDPAIVSKRDLLLKQAEIKIKNMKEKYPHYSKAILQLVTIKLLQQNTTYARSLLSTIGFKSDEYYLLLSITDLMDNKKAAAQKNIIKIKDSRLKILAEKNIKNNSLEIPCNEIKFSLATKNSELLQIKKIAMDDIQISWSPADIQIKNGSKTMVFSLGSFSHGKCRPLKIYGNHEVWNSQIIGVSIENSSNKQYYKYN